jgi:hypothetical protein
VGRWPWGGGGGSLNNAFANLIGNDGVPSGNGELDTSLRPAAAPESSTWAMLLLGFAGLGARPIDGAEAGAGQRKHSSQ